ADKPSLVTVSVKVISLPTYGVAELEDLESFTSAEATGTGVEVEVLLPGFGSYSVAVTEALFVYGPLARTLTVTSRVVFAPAARLNAGQLTVRVETSYVPEFSEETYS